MVAELQAIENAGELSLSPLSPEYTQASLVGHLITGDLVSGGQLWMGRV